MLDYSNDPEIKEIGRQTDRFIWISLIHKAAQISLLGLIVLLQVIVLWRVW